MKQGWRRGTSEVTRKWGKNEWPKWMKKQNNGGWNNKIIKGMNMHCTNHQRLRRGAFHSSKTSGNFG